MYMSAYVVGVAYCSVTIHSYPAHITVTTIDERAGLTWSERVFLLVYDTDQTVQVALI